ncbi:hypothetical protein [Kineococcus rubinsiae]|uniref:hypothetical protein n=1 Tax=Kineococcus rubinsiae TaxID=2609562 RepID=UPI001431608D|nr:hypothetical protein [Kineococcus rubinsiae]NIZ91570.1 hypothetical protein [Kineococcus rubinsiae]
MLTGRSAPVPAPPAWLTDDPAGLEQWHRLWELPSAEAWTASEHEQVARLAAMYAAGNRPGTRNAMVQGQLESRLLLTPIARRHAGVAVQGDLFTPGSTVAADVVSAFVDEPAAGVVVWNTSGVLLEQFGQLTAAGRRALRRAGARA